MISHGPAGTVQVSWRRPRFWLLVVSNPLWIALTAPARWLLDRTLQLYRAGMPWLPGARELVSEVRDAGLATALVTSTPRRRIHTSVIM